MGIFFTRTTIRNENIGQVSFKKLLKLPSFIAVGPGSRTRNKMFLGYMYSQELL